jgi:hypothetical protein
MGALSFRLLRFLAVVDASVWIIIPVQLFSDACVTGEGIRTFSFGRTHGLTNASVWRVHGLWTVRVSNVWFRCRCQWSFGSGNFHEAIFNSELIIPFHPGCEVFGKWIFRWGREASESVRKLVGTSLVASMKELLTVCWVLATHRQQNSLDVSLLWCRICRGHLWCFRSVQSGKWKVI